MTAQASAVTRGSEMQVEIAVSLLEPHPPWSARQPRDHDLGQAGVGSARQEVDGDLHRLLVGDIEPLVHRGWHSVDPHRVQGAREGDILRRVGASFGPLQRPRQRHGLHCHPHAEARDQEHAITDRDAPGAPGRFDHPAPQARQGDPHRSP